MGIHGDPIASRRKIDHAKRTGIRFEGDAYSYPRAFLHNLTHADRMWVRDQVGEERITLVDPTAGGGSIPFEGRRLGVETFANDLNPVAALILIATIDLPVRFGPPLLDDFKNVAAEFVKRRDARLSPHFPVEPEQNAVATNFLWARTIICPYCAGKVPLSPNWSLASGALGIRLLPRCGMGPSSGERVCEFEIVKQAADQSGGTVSDGDATCCFPDCGRVIDGDEVKRQAQANEMGEQIFAVVFRRPVKTRTKTGKRGKIKWQRDYRAARSEDGNLAELKRVLARKTIEWEASGVIPTEPIDKISNYDRGHRMYGMYTWSDMFSPRQLLVHGTSIEIFREMVGEDIQQNRLSSLRRATYIYLSLSIDKMINYNARSTRWDITTGRTRSVFDSHNFAMLWSYAEIMPLITGIGFDWTLEQTASCIEELVALSKIDDVDYDGPLFSDKQVLSSIPSVNITCKSGDNLDHLGDNSVDAVIIDPPYGANMMYAELSDFFYVWLKRTAGLLVPELFTRYLTDKDFRSCSQ